MTDSDAAMKESIAGVFPPPHTTHLLCSWHICKNIKKKCLSILKSEKCTDLLRRWTRASLATSSEVGTTKGLQNACLRRSPRAVVLWCVGLRVLVHRCLHHSYHQPRRTCLSCRSRPQAFDGVWKDVEDLVKGTDCEEYILNFLYE